MNFILIQSTLLSFNQCNHHVDIKLRNIIKVLCHLTITVH